MRTRKSMIPTSRLAVGAIIVLLSTAITPSAASASSASTVHTIDRLVEDARGLANPVKARFEGKHIGSSIDPYQIDMTVEKMSSTGSGGFLVFRELDSENFYQLDFRATYMKLSKKIAPTPGGNGVMTEVARGGRGFGAPFQPYSVRLVMTDNRFRVYEATDLTTPVMDWADAANSFPVGRNVSYYTTPGTLFCWERVEARPQNVGLALGGAWDLGGVPGYGGASQNTNGADVFLTNSRYPFTFERYDAPSDDGSVAWDMIELGQHGSQTWRVVAPSPGATVVYRSGSRSSTGLPRSGYAVRFDATATRWGTIDSNGVFTARAIGRALAVGEDASVVIGASTHSVNGGAGDTIIPAQTNTTYNGLRAYLGHQPGTTGRMAGSLTPR